MLGKDKVVVRAAAMAVGMEEVKRLAGIFIEKHKYLSAAKLTFAYCTGTFETFEPRAEEHEEAARRREAQGDNGNEEGSFLNLVLCHSENHPCPENVVYTRRERNVKILKDRTYSVCWSCYPD